MSNNSVAILAAFLTQFESPNWLTLLARRLSNPDHGILLCRYHGAEQLFEQQEDVTRGATLLGATWTQHPTATGRIRRSARLVHLQVSVEGEIPDRHPRHGCDYYTQCCTCRMEWSFDG